MFFTPELLVRRESGFGLLWLAATLGSKSTFKRLPRRSVLSADIRELCGLIAEPIEPLALRLSSNLMRAFNRVYKVKQDLLMTDVTHFADSLKKIIQGTPTTSSATNSLQMAQPIVRKAALNLASGRNNAGVIDFDTLIADWNEFFNLNFIPETTGGNHEYQERTSDKRRVPAPKKSSALPEDVRADFCTLKEDHGHLLAASPNFSQAFEGFDNSSSQSSLGFLDSPIGYAEDFDIGLIADELAQELGEGWSVAPAVNDKMNDYSTTGNMDYGDMNVEFEFDVGSGLPAIEPQALQGEMRDTEASSPTASQRNKRSFDDANKENVPPQAEENTTFSPSLPLLNHFLAQDGTFIQVDPLLFPVPDDQGSAEYWRKYPPKKITRLLLDTRTQLTDDELKHARSQYVENQMTLRREIQAKRMAKMSAAIVDERLMGPPPEAHEVQALALIHLWEERFEVQVEAQSQKFKHTENDGPPPKKRKTKDSDPFAPSHFLDPDEIPAPTDEPYEMELGPEGLSTAFDVVPLGAKPRMSSDEPGQARRVSRQSSVFGNQLEPSYIDSRSQKSSFFPWDHAGSNSSTEDHNVTQDLSLGRLSDISCGSAGLRTLGSPLNSTEGGYVAEEHGAGFIGEDFVFPLEPSGAQSQPNLVALERNSLNFLEYSKMQRRTLPDGSKVSFDDIVPRTSSTRRIAASAFYHCLALATKDLVRLYQPRPFENIVLEPVN